MGLFINQGHQDTSKDDFSPIVANDVTMVIFGMELIPDKVGWLKVSFRILEGEYKNRFVYDRIAYDPNSNMSWKYRQLRKCAGVPYNKNESEQIDIEALLKDKVIKANLSERKWKGQDGTERISQQIDYKEYDEPNDSDTIIIDDSNIDAAFEAAMDAQEKEIKSQQDEIDEIINDMQKLDAQKKSIKEVKPAESNEPSLDDWD